MCERQWPQIHKEFWKTFSSFFLPVCTLTWPLMKLTKRKKNKSLASMTLWAFPSKGRLSELLFCQGGPLIYHGWVLSILKSHDFFSGNVTSNWIKILGYYITTWWFSITMRCCNIETQWCQLVWFESYLGDRRVVSSHLLNLAIRQPAMPTEVGIANWQHWGWQFIVGTYSEFHVLLLFFFHWLLWFLWLLLL